MCLKQLLVCWFVARGTQAGLLINFRFSVLLQWLHMRYCSKTTHSPCVDCRSKWLALSVWLAPCRNNRAGLFHQQRALIQRTNSRVLCCNYGTITPWYCNLRTLSSTLIVRPQDDNWSVTKMAEQLQMGFDLDRCKVMLFGSMNEGMDSFKQNEWQDPEEW